MSQSDTKSRILDAAEQLFSRQGYHGTSLRAITAEAGVNLAAVNYHFGAKEALLEAVFERRLVPLNRARRQKLQAVTDKASAGGRSPGVRETLNAFIEPTLALRDTGAQAEAFFVLVGRTLAEPDNTLRTIFARHMEPMFHLLTEALSAALPQMPQGLLTLRLQFALGAMANTLCLACRPPLPAGAAAAGAGVDDLLGLLLDFITAGMEAP